MAFRFLLLGRVRSRTHCFNFQTHQKGIGPGEGKRKKAAWEVGVFMSIQQTKHKKSNPLYTPPMLCLARTPKKAPQGKRDKTPLLKVHSIPMWPPQLSPA